MTGICGECPDLEAQGLKDSVRVGFTGTVIPQTYMRVFECWYMGSE